MLNLKIICRATSLLCVLILSACTTPDTATTVIGNNEIPQESVPANIAESPQSIAIQRARILADILYAAKYAYDDNKLMRPAGDNAYDRYLEVLSIEPENIVALEGIQEIILRYVELADTDMARGRYDNAESLLDRAASIDLRSEGVLAALSRLEEARKVKINFYELDPAELSKQSIAMLTELAEIAEIARLEEATFLITARTDDEGRWIYKIMREAVDGYRLRGNIALGNIPGVQINVLQP